MARNKSAIRARQLARRESKAIYAAMKSKDLRFDGFAAGGSVQIQAAGKGESGEDELAKFSMVAYTGSKMRPGGWYANAPIIVDLAGMHYPASGVIPVHRDHDTSKVVGHTTAIEAKNQLKLAGVVSATNDHASEIVGSSKNQFPWQSSIGATLLAEPQFVPEGETVYVNGRRHAGPVYVARKTRLFEASFVSLGADSRTSAVAATHEGSDMKFEQWLTAKGFVMDTLSDSAIAVLRAAYQAETSSDDDEASEKKKTVTASAVGEDDDTITEIDPVAERRKKIAAEMKRESLIAAKLSRYPDLMAKAVEEGWDENKIELEGLRASAAKAPAIHVAATLNETPDAIEAALYMSQGIGSEDRAVKTYGEKAVTAARSRVPRAAGLQWLCHQVIRAGGEYAEPGVFDTETMRAAFRADRALRAQSQRANVYASSGFSTISLSGVLGNLAHKALLAAYESIPSVIPFIARVASHSDFKQHSKYRTTTAGYLEEVGPTGEIQHTEISEETYGNIVKTYARMVALTRQMMKNDDLGAFLAIPQAFGRITATTKEKSLFETLLDNTDGFFATAPTGRNANQLAAGGSSALSLASLGVAENLFLDQVDKDGKPIGLTPSVLLVDSSKKRDATNLVNRTTVTVAGDPATGEQVRIGNEYQGEFQPVASPWVHNTQLTGASATQWWLFAAPSADVAVLEIAYLDGMTKPIMESAETDFNTLGMQWRCIHDWGIAKQDPRAGVRSPGA